MTQIDERALCREIFGITDSHSGYGAHYPNNPRILSFFKGRLGDEFPLDCVLARKTHTSEQRDAIRALAKDLQDAAAGLLEICK